MVALKVQREQTFLITANQGHIYVTSLHECSKSEINTKEKTTIHFEKITMG